MGTSAQGLLAWPGLCPLPVFSGPASPSQPEASTQMAGVSGSPMWPSCLALCDLRAFPWGENHHSQVAAYKYHTISSLKTLAFPHSLQAKSKFLTVCFHHSPNTHANACLPTLQTSRQVLSCHRGLPPSLGCLSPPLPDKLLLVLHHPTSLSPLVSFPCSLRTPRRSPLPKIPLPLHPSMVLKLKCASASCRGFLKHRLLAPTPRV